MRFFVTTACDSLNEAGVRSRNQVKLLLAYRRREPYSPERGMRATRLAFVPAFLAILFLAAIPVHAEVYKWVDENGKAHYSDQPPGKAKLAPLHIKAAPINSQPESENEKNLSNQMQDRHQQLLDDANARLKAARDQRASEEKSRAEQRRIADEREELQKAIDDKRIAECKHNHEVYCDNGVEGIDKAEAARNADYGARQERAFRGGY